MNDATEDAGLAAGIPRRDPSTWEGHEGFRETFLLYVTDPKTNETLRALGATLSELTLECAAVWPRHAISLARAELSAALAELRYLEGFLQSVGNELTTSNLDAADIRLAQCAGRQSAALRSIAEQIEGALAE